MSLLFFSRNLVALAAGITIQPPGDPTRPFQRLFDYDKGLRYRSQGAAWSLIDIFPITMAQIVPINVTLDMLFSSAEAATAFFMVNHNVLSTGLKVFKSTDGIAYTEVARIPVTGIDPVYFEFSSTAHAETRWRIQFASSATSTEQILIGEIGLGVPRYLSNPSMTRTKESILGNVRRDESIGGYTRKIRLGEPRVRLNYGWDTLKSSDWTEAKAIFDDIDEGTKNLLVRLPDDTTIRWVEVVESLLETDPFTNNLRRMSISLQDAL